MDRNIALEALGALSGATVTLPGQQTKRRVDVAGAGRRGQIQGLVVTDVIQTAPDQTR